MKRSISSRLPKVLLIFSCIVVLLVSLFLPTKIWAQNVLAEHTPEIQSKLESVLYEHPPKPLAITNFLQHAIRQAIQRGVSANTIVLILLFPLVAAIIAASRQIIGIGGFGIFLPAVLSVVFVSTGIVEGLLLFITITLMATL